jgi:hypothetical protein
MPLNTKKLTKWLFWIGLIMFVLGVSFAACNRTWYRTRTWSVVAKPIDLNAGSKFTQEFQTNIDENFLVMLEVDRGLPQEVAERVLGVGDFVSGGRTDLHGFRMRWAVLNNGIVVKKGISDGNGEGYWSRRIGRILGFFPAKKGQKYKLDLEVLDDGSGLNPYHPSLLVRVDIFTLDGYAMGEGISELAGLIVAGLGLLFLAPVVPIWGWLVTRKTNHRRGSD